LTSPPSASRLPARSAIAVAGERAVSALSRRLGRGAGDMIGGKVALRVDPRITARLAQHRPVACVSGTNGKTTTTRLLAAALATDGPVVSNSGGANMTPGVVHALALKPRRSAAALEVDEIWLPGVAREVLPRAVLLLNISRDQLDRSNETRRIAALWRSLGTDLPTATAVANADDPLVVWAAQGFPAQRWVAAGQNWTADAMVCPSCGQLLRRSGEAPNIHWWCTCGLSRPTPDVAVLSSELIAVGESRWPVQLLLPGRVNTANAAMAMAGADLFGVKPGAALAAMEKVGAVQGRYSQVALGGTAARLLLAKNPAGWVEMLELLDASPPRPVVIDFNSRVADGRDPSWLWDVPFERLAGRQVLVTGERRHDMSARLTYAGIDHTVHDNAEAAAAASDHRVSDQVDVVANYTAFRDLLVRTSA
jgi:lipid II isoglutaminyl synthase (glutamine-hydrolysing)